MKLFLQKFTLTVVAVLFAGVSTLLAQRVISGRVTDAETGEGLIGASVVAVGTTSGALTDVDGNYSFRLPDGVTRLRIAYTGYSEQFVDITAANNYDVQLAPGTALGEVVVIGYGQVRREDVTGSVVTVSPERFNKGAIVAPQELIAGRVAGVQITPAPEGLGGATIRIRGGSSLSASNDPLIVIDGVPVLNDGPAGTRNPLNIVNPNDIETFTVLKDASATAIYGSRASNGVILITTKKGSLKNRFRVDYGGQISASNTLNRVDVLGADAYRNLVRQRFNEDDDPRQALLGTANTDWQDQIYQTGIGTDHSLGLSGGIGNWPYRVGLGYTARQGVLKTDKLDRFTGSLNLSPSFLNNMLQVNLGFKSVYDQNFFANRGAIGAAVAFDPTQPVRASGFDNYGGYYAWLQQNGNPITIATANPVALLEQRADEGSATRYILNGSFDYRLWFLPDLRANLNLAYDRSNSEGTVVVQPNAAFAFTNKGEKREYTQDRENSLLEFYLNYNKKLNVANRLDLLAGYSWQRFFVEDFSAATNFVGDVTIDVPNTNPAEYFLLSLFGRVNYTFQDRWLLTATVRRDGSSRFGPDARWGLFPSAALAYKAVDNPEAMFSALKLRVGYGETGQQDIGNFYNYLPTYLASQSTAQYQIGTTFVPTLRPGGYDANIKWETTETINFAIDYGFWSNRVNGTLELYQRTTRDLLNFVPVPAGTNLTNFLNTNVGDLENRGVEFSVNVMAISNERSSWEIGANVTANRNEITRLTATDDPNYLGVLTGGISGAVGNTIQIHSVGYAANSFFVYEQAYDQNGVPVEGVFVDRNGDGQVTPEDRYRFENPAPNYFFGFFSNYNRGPWDFSFAGRANVGNYNYNNVLSEGAQFNRLYNSAGYLNNVHSDATTLDLRTPQYFSDYFIQDASFLRLDHITLGYSLNELGRFSNLRLYATVQNPFVITKYEGLDPEVFGGIDNNIYPRARTFVFGVNASL